MTLAVSCESGSLNPMSFTDQHGAVLLERMRYQRETGWSLFSNFQLFYCFTTNTQCMSFLILKSKVIAWKVDVLIIKLQSFTNSIHIQPISLCFVRDTVFLDVHVNRVLEVNLTAKVFCPKNIKTTYLYMWSK